MEKTTTAELTANKGILLIAIGSTEYLEMAKNLAMSIKNVEPTMQIALAHNFGTIESKLFDVLVDVPFESYNTNGQVEFIKVKTWMYDFSPFQETIFLDVDMVWLFNKKPSELFELCKGLNWTMSNTGIAETSIWTDITEVRKLYPSSKMWNYHSECVYFNKCEKSKKYFDKVRSIYENPPVKGTNFGGARIADELAFQLASIELNEYPHKENFTPIFWYARDKKETNLAPHKLKDLYFAYSVGGNRLPQNVKNNFMTISNYHAQTSKLSRAYRIKDKRTFIKERMKL